MKPQRSLVLALLVVFVFAFPGNSCGPFFPEAVFVLHHAPDGPHANYVKGQLGVPLPGYSLRHLVIAYDWLNGAGLSANEQQQAIQLNAFLDAAAEGDDDDSSASGAKQPSAADAWLVARKDSGVPVPPVAKPAPGVYVDNRLDADRRVPGASYESFPNCLDPAFTTATQTLKDRKAAHANDAASFADWVRGQDTVFANCNGFANALPADAPAGAPAWLRQDRAYQRAAAAFYQTDYDVAIAQLKTIAADTSSPWHGIAPLVAARAMIRRATIGQITDVPDAAIEQPNADYNKERADAQQKYAALVAQKRPQRLAEARDALRAIVMDPSLESEHADASGLLDFVMIRLDPAAQAQTLAARASAPSRPQIPGVFKQALIDLHYLNNRYLNDKDRPDADNDTNKTNQATPRQAAKPTPQADLLAWIDAMQGASRDIPDSVELPTDNQLATQRAKNRVTANDALARWRATHSIPWLVAALTAAEANDDAIPDLLQAAAAAVPKDSPAWTAATYYRIRFTPSPSAMRTELDALSPTLQGQATRSTINLFRMLRQNSSPTLDAFLKDAGTLPAGIIFDTDLADPPGTKPDPQGLCGVTTSQAETLLFDQDAANVLNTRMPLTLLADAAANEALSRNLRFQIAQATWARAVLLRQPAVAKRMSPILIGCYPAWKPSLDAYDSATREDDRHVNGLLALMRFASTEPYVRAGMQRPDGFATYSEYRDNWWQATASNQPTLGTTTAATPAEQRDPPFLTSADRAAADREVASLRTVACASDYFARQALDWQKQHPADPRTPNVLGFAERVVRNGCSTDATKDLNHQLFVIVQAKYPKSEWAKKYPTWE